MPRLFFWLLVTMLLVAALAVFNPQQLPVVLYKAALVTGGVLLGYWLDRSIFYYARPHTQFQMALRLAREDSLEGSRAMRMAASLATLRRAVIVLACVLGLTLGL